MSGRRRSGLAAYRRAYGCACAVVPTPRPTYTVTYNGNANTGGSVPVDSSSPYEVGSTVAIAGNSGTLVRTGYVFAGWNTAANGSGTPYAQGGSFSIDADVVLYAQWTPVLYTVVYNSNTATGGAVPTDSSSPYLAGSSVTVAGNTGSLAKTGYTFAGWNTAANGTGTSYVQGNTFTINANTILYAKWTAVPSVLTPTALSSVGGDRAAYILFSQTGSITNYEYSTDDGATFVAFSPAQTFSPVHITALSSDGTTPLTNGVTYTVKLKAVNGAASSPESLSVDVTPATNTLLATNRLIHLDANNASSYSGTGSVWTNLDSAGTYSANLLNGPVFDSTNKWFTFDGNNQIAEIAAAAALNPTTPFGAFTVQIWARVDTASPNFASNDGLISKQYGSANDYDGYSLGLSSSGVVVLNMNGAGVNGNYFSPAGVYSNNWALYTIVVRFGGGSSNPSYVYVSTRQVRSATNGESGMSSPSAPLQFPRGIQDGPWNYCPADVGAFYLYNAALSQADIIRNFDATKTRYSL